MLILIILNDNERQLVLEINEIKKYVIVVRPEDKSEKDAKNTRRTYWRGKTIEYHVQRGWQTFEEKTPEGENKNKYREDDEIAKVINTTEIEMRFLRQGPELRTGFGASPSSSSSFAKPVMDDTCKVVLPAYSIHVVYTGWAKKHLQTKILDS